MIVHRSENGTVRDYSEIFPEVKKGCIRDTQDVKHLIDINPKDGFISLEEFQHWSKENKVN